MSVEVSVSDKTEAKIMTKPARIVEELRIIYKQEGHFIFTIEHTSWLSVTQSFKLDLDNLNCLQEYFPSRFMIYGPSETCWALYETLPETWISSLPKVEIHLNDKSLTKENRLHWKEEVKRRLGKMETVTNIIIGDGVFGTKALMLKEGWHQKFCSDNSLKQFLVYGKDLNPNFPEYDGLRRELAIKSTRSDQLAVLMSKRSTITNILKDFASRRGGKRTSIDDPSILLKEQDGTSTLFLEANPRLVESPTLLFLVKILPFVMGVIGIIIAIASIFTEPYSETERMMESKSCRIIRSMLPFVIQYFTFGSTVVYSSSWRKDAYC